MRDISALILNAISKKSYQPMSAKALARKLGLAETAQREFRGALKALIRDGKAQLGKNDTIRPVPTLPKAIGTFKRLASGDGIVRIEAEEGLPPKEYYVPDHLTHDAATGDEVMIGVRKRATHAADGLAEISEVVRRATRQFVGTYFTRDGAGYVRVDGEVFTHSIEVGDSAVKGAKPNDKVVLEMVRFPTALVRGEGVIVEILGRTGDPKVDTTAIVRALGIPDKFPEEALEEARQQALTFREDDLTGREDFTQQLVITIDPADAKDFDDAVSLKRDGDTGHWLLTVHIADVSHFVPVGGPLDREARERGTSVYLPQRVIPMFPEVISNGLASLQEAKIRYVMTAEMEFTAEAEPVGARFARSAIRNRKRFSYEQVQAILQHPSGDAASGVAPEIVKMLLDMRTLSLLMRARRSHRGSLEMSMPEPVLEYDDKGHVSGAHFAVQDESHQLIESFMLAANEAVATHFDKIKAPFLQANPPRPRSTQAGSVRDLRPHARLQVATQARPGRSATHPQRKRQDRREARGSLRPPPQLEESDLFAGTGRTLCPGERSLHALHLADPPLSRFDRASRTRSMARTRQGALERKGAAQPRRALLEDRTPSGNGRARSCEDAAALVPERSPGLDHGRGNHRRNRVRLLRPGQGVPGGRLGPRQQPERRLLPIRRRRPRARRAKTWAPLSAGR